MVRKRSTSKSSSASRRPAGYVGSNTFPDEQPVCKPIAPGRRIKPLEGPVHPGFKGKPKTKVKKAPTRPVIRRSDQTDDLYKPMRKVSPPKKKRRK